MPTKKGNESSHERSIRILKDLQDYGVRRVWWMHADWSQQAYRNVNYVKKIDR